MEVCATLYQEDRVKLGLNGACGKHGTAEDVCKVLPGTSEGKEPFGNHSANRRIILNWIVNKMGLCELDSHV